MKRFVLLLCLLPLIANAQLIENFDDSDFTNNPAWSGDAHQFFISTNSVSGYSQPPRLRLRGDSTASDVSHLSFMHALTSLDNTQWEFWARVGLNTSTNNNCRFYLTSDNSNLEAPLNGYFVLFGDDASSTLDSISLCRQTGSSYVKIIRGTAAFTGASANFRIKVTRDNAGLWNLYSDPAGQTNFALEGSATDTTYTTSAYTGVMCKYTTSNYMNFHFDDIYIGPIFNDITPPHIISASAVSATGIDVLFSESVEKNSAETLANYWVPGNGNPSSASRDNSNQSLVHLSFGNQFPFCQMSDIQVNNVTDIYGNPCSDTAQFAWCIPQPWDVVINEIMADPDPVVGLPNYEYIELHNRTSLPVNLSGWILRIGKGSTADKVLPNVTILPDSFLIITETAATAAFASYGPVIGLSSFSITNSGTSLTLKRPNGQIIHYLNFSDAWYRDNSKKSGGWSLEQIDPSNPCSQAPNWTAAIDITGGTPGRVNSVNMPNPDVAAPQLLNVRPVNYYTLEATLNEITDSTGLTQLSKYFVDMGIGAPLTVTVAAPEFRKITLVFANPFLDNVIYTLTINDSVKDCVGNYAVNLTKTFSLYQPREYEILIHEIMSDPDPVVGLPNQEYIELYNRTAFPISLSKWKMVFGSTVKTIPDITIDANGYALLCNTGAAVSFASYGTADEISGFSLTNSGQALMLLDTSNRLISFLTYSNTWHSSSKVSGGWSLEMIDVNNPCEGFNNWASSIDAMGGTPGKANSVAASNPDLISPRLVRAAVSRLEINKVRLFFSEALDSINLTNPLKYSIDNNIGNPALVKLTPPDNKSVILYLSQNLQYNVIYELTVTDSVIDCAGNLLPLSSKVRFAIPVLPDSADLVINELLSNPNTDGIDFVEIYNRSEKVIDLMDMVLSNFDSLNNALTSPQNVSNEGYLVFPGDHIVLCKDPDVVKSQYQTPNPDNFAAMSSFPSYNNDDGFVALTTRSQKFIDFLSYKSGMHFPLLTSTKGVTLERINYHRPASDKTNWHSAAANVGYGTPGYKNSQYAEYIADDGAVTISPDIFSPDNDGYNDVLNISYTFDQPGYIANIVIYDSRGRLVKNLVKNSLLGTSGAFSWDGTSDSREKANIGVYIIYFEVFDLSGKVKAYKKSGILGSKLK